ncbi:hypothetical protein ACFX16_044165 [Malus domestica]
MKAWLCSADGEKLLRCWEGEIGFVELVPVQLMWHTQPDHRVSGGERRGVVEEGLPLLDPQVEAQVELWCTQEVSGHFPMVWGWAAAISMMLTAVHGFFRRRA